MHLSSIREAPINPRGEQTSYLLLGKAQFGSERLAVTRRQEPRQPGRNESSTVR